MERAAHASRPSLFVTLDLDGAAIRRALAHTQASVRARLHCRRDFALRLGDPRPLAYPRGRRVRGGSSGHWLGRACRRGPALCEGKRRACRDNETGENDTHGRLLFSPELTPPRGARCGSLNFEMFGELEALRLVVRANALAVKRVRPREHLLVDKAADDLPVLQDERYLARAYFEHRAAPLPARARISEPRIEEARIVHAELADERVERHHLGRIVRRDLHCLLGGKNVEFIGIE